MEPKVIYSQERKFQARCDVYGCRKIADHYIGHSTHKHTGFRLCHNCFQKILKDIELVAETRTVPESAAKEPIQYIKNKKTLPKLNPESYYWNSRSNLTRLRNVCKARGIVFKEEDIRRTLMEKLRHADPSCEVMGEWND